MEQDVNEVMELLELAVTWTELDYSESLVIPPEQWLTFAAAHTWGNPDRVLRLFSVATDIALSRAPRPSPSRALRSATTDREVRHDGAPTLLSEPVGLGAETSIVLRLIQPG